MIFSAICFIGLAISVFGAELSTVNQNEATKFLEKFGYLNGNQRSPLARTRAIKDFQDYAGLKVTGQLDEATKRMMVAPRCGMSDRKLTRTTKWPKTNLKWSLVKGTNQLDDGAVRKAIREALDIWTAVTPLNFTETSPQDQSADLKFSFGAGGHGCYWPFDGQGNVLAHAAYSPGGYLHYDDDERWTYENPEEIRDYYTDLLSVSIHEIGHALGLPHLKEQGAIMFAYYAHPELDENGNIKPFVLSQYDIAAIQNLYGPRPGGSGDGGDVATPKPTWPTMPSPKPEQPTDEEDSEGGDCVDQASTEDCESRKEVCHHEAMKHWCPKTCGFC